MKTVMITGCSSGFGKATAQMFYDNGWNVVATMRKPQIDLFNADSKRLTISALDVTNAENVKATVDGALKSFGQIDVLVNNAGLGLFAPLETTPDQMIRVLFETNVLGSIAMIRALLPHMHERRSGTIVNISSSMAFSPLPLNSIYSSTKWAIEGLSEALYHELSPLGLVVKLVEPGYAKSTGYTDKAMHYVGARQVPSAYQFTLGKVMAGASLPGTGIEETAAAIFEAANDASTKLRFPVGIDSLNFAKQRAELGEDAFLAAMRQFWG